MSVALCPIDEPRHRRCNAQGRAQQVIGLWSCVTIFQAAGLRMVGKCSLINSDLYEKYPVEHGERQGVFIS